MPWPVGRLQTFRSLSSFSCLLIVLFFFPKSEHTVICSFGAIHGCKCNKRSALAAWLPLIDESIPIYSRTTAPPRQAAPSAHHMLFDPLMASTSTLPACPSHHARTFLHMSGFDGFRIALS